jgi:POT family proton-dependent oligopeptide transporter
MQDPQSIAKQTTSSGTDLAITTARVADDGVALSPEGYRTVPDQVTTAWPAGVPYIVGNEVCERFSFYGMKAILMVHLIALYTAAAVAEASAQARGTLHLFVAGVYALPMIGAIIADRLAGKYKTILYISLFYCAGHAALSIWENNLTGVYLGLALIAVGSGGIKPCVSANVGDQFGKGNWFRVRTVYQIFYFSVNFGSFFATLLIPRIKDVWGPGIAESVPWLAERVNPSHFGTSVAFAIPGILMFLATFIFWLGRRKFVHVPPSPGGKIGLLDTLSSTFLFMAVGHLFFTAGAMSWFPQSWPHWLLLTSTLSVLGLISAGFLVAGLVLFQVRQRIQPDDGFLAIMFYTLGRFFRGEKVDTRSANPPTGESGNGSADDMGWLARSGFWGPGVQRFGQSATEGPVAVLKIISVLFLISVFWALFDQHASSWIEQAKLMDLSLHGLDETLSFSLFGRTFQPLPAGVLANEIQALNPLLVMLLIPLMNLVYLGCDRLSIKTPPLRRITVGMGITALSFVAAALIQHQIDARGEGQVWFAWQIVPYLLLTIGEVMVSITALEFAYTQAPKRMKSTIMSFLNLTVALGNVLVALLSYFSGLKLAPFFWVFAALMAGAGVLFGLRAIFYVQKDYSQ